MDIDVDFPVSAPSDLECLEQWSEVRQQGIYMPSFLTHAAAITGKIDERSECEVISVVEDPEKPDPQRQLGDQTMTNMDDGQHAPLIRTDAGAHQPQLPVIVHSKVKRLHNLVCSPIPVVRP